MADTGDVGDFLQNVFAGDDFAEGGIFVIQERRITVTNEELAPGAIWVGRPGHGEDALGVRTVIKLGFDLVPRAAGAGLAFAAGFGVRATALDHEAFDDAVESGLIVKSFAGELQEVVDGARGDFGPEFDSHVAGRGVDNRAWGGGFIHGFGGRGAAAGRQGQGAEGQ